MEGARQVDTGILVHRFLPRVWTAVFPVVPAARNLDDFHLILRSKSNRVTRWFLLSRMPVVACLVSVLAGPLDHLLQRMQYLDEAGGILITLCTAAASPISEAQRAFAKMLQSPMDTAAEILFRHFGYDGATIQELAQAVRGGILRLSGLLWWLLGMPYTWFPYKLVCLVVDDVTESIKAAVSAELFKVKPCCLDCSFSLKARLGQSGVGVIR